MSKHKGQQKPKKYPHPLKSRLCLLLVFENPEKEQDQLEAIQ
jgi:hypothetical protein